MRIQQFDAVIAGIPADYGFPISGCSRISPSPNRPTLEHLPRDPVSAGTSLVRTRVRATKRQSSAKMNVVDPGELPAHIASAKGFNLSADRLQIGPEHALESNNVMLEDIYACEKVQEGMGSSLFSRPPVEMGGASQLLPEPDPGLRPPR